MIVNEAADTKRYEEAVKGAPICLKEINYSTLFGLISLSAYIEDRRPDLPVGEFLGKYKTQVHVRFFNFQFNMVVRSAQYPPTFYKNDKRLPYPGDPE